MTSYLISAPDFNLDATLDSGQVFGFRKADGGAYEGELAGAWARLSSSGGRLRVETENGAPSEAAVRAYFDLGRDLARVYAALESDERLAPALALKGLRLIRQDAWEALACFIISANNNVKRIQGIWKNLSDRLGEPSGLRRRFPSAARVAAQHERVLRELGLGYRAPYLSRTAQFVAANPGCLEHIRACGYEEAKARVLAFPGIGEKVADCALLYGFQKYEAFPVDVWIARAMRKLYFRNRRVAESRIRRFGQKRWGADAGYVQQYLFHAARTGIL